MSTLDESAIALVSCLRHRVGTQRSCKCEECRAIIRVCALAREAVAMKEANLRVVPVRLSAQERRGA